MTSLGLWPARDCPECGKEFGEHAEGCRYPADLAARESKAKKALAEFGAETIEDILSLVDMRSCNSLQGSVWRLAEEIVAALEIQRAEMIIALSAMQNRLDTAKRHIAKIESVWLSEDKSRTD